MGESGPLGKAKQVGFLARHEGSRKCSALAPYALVRIGRRRFLAKNTPPVGASLEALGITERIRLCTSYQLPPQPSQRRNSLKTL